MFRAEASGPAGYQSPQQQHGCRQPPRPDVRHLDRQAGRDAGGSPDGAQAQLHQSDARRHHQQNGQEEHEDSYGNESREDGDSEKEYEDARRLRAVDQALGNAEESVRAAVKLSGAFLYGDTLALEIRAQSTVEVEALLQTTDPSSDRGAPGSLGESNPRWACFSCSSRSQTPQNPALHSGRLSLH